MSPIIIANPTAGIGAGRAPRQRLIEAAHRELERSGFVSELQMAEDSHAVTDIAARAVREGRPSVIAAGGDGTVNAVVNGMMRAARGHPARVENTVLGVLPFGTGNVFAFNMGIGKTWRDACQIIRNGHVRRIDVGLARSVPAHSHAASGREHLAGEHAERAQQKRHFLLMAGIGFDAKVVEETSLRLKYVLRDFAYVLKTLQNVVLHQGTQMTLRFDEGRVYANEAWLVMVGNAASYAWDIKVTTHAQLDDGLLDVCLMPFENKIVSIQQAMQILTGQHIESGTAQYWKASGLRIESEPPVPIQLDGDEWAHTPVEISVLPGALPVFAPVPVEDGTEA